MSNNVDLLEKLESLGLIDRVEALVREAEEDQKLREVTSLLTGKVYEALAQAKILKRDGDGYVLTSWPFSGKSLVVRIFDNGDAGVAIEVKKEAKGGEKRKGNGGGRGKPCVVRKDGRVWEAPNGKEAIRGLRELGYEIDDGGLSAFKALSRAGFEVEIVEDREIKAFAEVR